MRGTDIGSTGTPLFFFINDAVYDKKKKKEILRYNVSKLCLHRRKVTTIYTTRV